MAEGLSDKRKLGWGMWIAKTTVPVVAMLAGMFFGFWLTIVIFRSIPDPGPSVPDWVWIIPDACSIFGGMIGFFVAQALMRRITGSVP